MILFGLFVIWRWGIIVVVNAYDSVQWPAVPGTIIHSELTSHVRDFASSSEQEDGYHDYRTVYDAKVFYAYSVGGRKYYASTISFALADEYLSRKFVSDYPTGKEVSVYYKPSNPEVAVLIPGVTFGSFANLITGSLFTLAVTVLFVLLSPARAARRQENRPL